MTTTKPNWILFLIMLIALSAWSTKNVASAASPLLQEEEESEDRESEDRESEDRESEDQEKEEEDEKKKQGDDEEEEERREHEEDDISLEHVLEFTQEYMPEVAKHLKEILEEEGENEEVIEHILDRGREMIHGFHETKETHGRRLGEKFLQLFRINLQIEMLHEEAEEIDPKSRSKLRKHLKNLVAERYALELALEKAELNLLKAEVEEFEEEIKRRVENREEIIADHVNEFFEEHEGEEEEESEDRGEEEPEGDDRDEEEDDDDKVDEEDDKEEDDEVKKKVAQKVSCP